MKVSNANVVSKEIEDYKIDVEAKLKRMIAAFARELTEALSNNTPIGDQASIDVGRDAIDGPASEYYKYYNNRLQEHRIEEKVGYHKGAYGYAESDNFYFNNEIHSTEESFGNAYYTALSDYNIGDTFYIGAKGPGFAELQDGDSEQAPDGIMEPAIMDIMRIDLPALYDSN